MDSSNRQALTFNTVDEFNEYRKENPNLFDFSSLDYQKRDCKLNDDEAVQEGRSLAGARRLLGCIARNSVSLLGAKISKAFKKTGGTEVIQMFQFEIIVCKVKCRLYGIPFEVNFETREWK